MALAQEPDRALHHRLVEGYLPDTTMEEALWPSARPLLGKASEAELRRFYLGAYYTSPAGRERAGAPPEPPLQVAVPPPPPLPRVLQVEGDTVTRVDGPIDFAIVGSGPAGCVAARVLTERGFRVVVVEAGSLAIPGSVDGRRVGALRDSHFTRSGSVYVQRGFGVGGGATVNVDLAFPPVRERFQRWGLDLPLEEGYAWVVQALGTRHVAFSEVNANNRVLWDGARAAGLTPSLYDLNTWPPGESPFVVTDKRSPLECLLLPAVRDGAGLLTDTEVVSLQGTTLELRTRAPWSGAWKDPSGLGLEGRYRLSARKVLLCAGALGTAVLLQRSGVSCGSGLVLHPSLPVVGIYDRPIENWRGTSASVYVSNGDTILEAMSAGPEYVANLIFDPRVHELMRAYPRMAGFGVMLVDSVQPSNRVRPDGSIDYELSSADRARFSAGVATAVRIHFLAGARRVILPTTEGPSVLDSPDQFAGLQFLPGRTLLTSSHIQGTCKLGVVTDLRGQVKGHPDWYILDSSLFPESVGVNPMQSIYTRSYLLSRSLTP